MRFFSFCLARLGMRLEAKGSWLLSLALLGNLVGCGGSSKSNEGFDTSLNDGPGDVTDVAFKNSRDRWNALAAALGVGNNEASSREALVTSLSTPSSIILGALTDATKLTEIQTKVTTSFAAKAYATRCAAVDSFEEWTVTKPFAYKADGTKDSSIEPATKIYKMKYRLFSAKGDAATRGTAETTARSGLVIVPNAAYLTTTGAPSSAPVVAYAHGGDSGLSYSGELARLFGKFQTNHVIVAPTYPGEALCKGGTDPTKKSCDAEGVDEAAVGKSIPWDTDVDELLGMYDCVAKASLAKDSGLNASQVSAVGLEGDAAGTLLTALSGVTKKMGTGAFANFPASFIVGASRGGLVANLALTQVGAQLSAYSTAKAADAAATFEAVFGKGYGNAPSTFSCALSISAPTTFAHARPRIALEYMVKDTLKSSPLAGIPGFLAMNDVFKGYREGTQTLDDAVLEVTKRDITFTSGLLLAGLKQWKSFGLAQTTPGGAIAFLHSTADKVYGYGETQLGYNALALFSGVSTVLTQTQTTTTAPWKTYARLFEPEVLDPKATYHVDSGFLGSYSMISKDFIILGVNEPLTDAAREAGAVGLASVAFTTATPTDAQKKVGRIIGAMGPTFSSLVSALGSSTVNETVAGAVKTATGITVAGATKLEKATTFGGTKLGETETEYLYEVRADNSKITPVEAFASWRLANSFNGCAAVL
jgi:hypothetical protein